MNYKRAALEELSKLPAVDKEFRKALIYAILSLGQTDEAEAVVEAAVRYVTAQFATPEESQAHVDLETAVMELVG